MWSFAELTRKQQRIWDKRRRNVEWAIAHNFLRAERDQPFLLPPDLRDWLPDGHLAWFILDVVDQLDLAPFYRQHRDDGHGHPAYDPKTLLGVLLYGCCLGVRSSRQLERRLHEDIAFRVLAANQTRIM